METDLDGKKLTHSVVLILSWFRFCVRKLQQDVTTPCLIRNRHISVSQVSVRRDINRSAANDWNKQGSDSMSVYVLHLQQEIWTCADGVKQHFHRHLTFQMCSSDDTQIMRVYKPRQSGRQLSWTSIFQDEKSFSAERFIILMVINFFSLSVYWRNENETVAFHLTVQVYRHLWH